MCRGRRGIVRVGSKVCYIAMGGNLGFTDSLCSGALAGLSSEIDDRICVCAIGAGAGWFLVC